MFKNVLPMYLKASLLFLPLKFFSLILTQLYGFTDWLGLGIAQIVEELNLKLAMLSPNVQML